MASLPSISSLPSLDAEKRAQVLDLLFEPCTQLHTLSVSLLHEQSFSSYPELIEAVGRQLQDLQQSNLESDHKWLDAILSAHPRLGEKKVDSEQSRKEQAQLNQGGAEEAEKLARLNRKYEDAFPGLRYVYVSHQVLPFHLDPILSDYLWQELSEPVGADDLVTASSSTGEADPSSWKTCRSE